MAYEDEDEDENIAYGGREAIFKKTEVVDMLMSRPAGVVIVDPHTTFPPVLEVHQCLKPCTACPEY